MRIQTAKEEGSSCVKLLTQFPIDPDFYILQSIPLFSKGFSAERKKSILHIHTTLLIVF